MVRVVSEFRLGLLFKWCIVVSHSHALVCTMYMYMYMCMPYLAWIIIVLFKVKVDDNSRKF